METKAELTHRNLDLKYFSHIQLINDQIEDIEYIRNLAIKLRNIKSDYYGQLSDEQNIDTEILIASLGKLVEKETDMLMDFKLA